MIKILLRFFVHALITIALLYFNGWVYWKMFYLFDSPWWYFPTMVLNMALTIFVIANAVCAMFTLSKNWADWEAAK